MRVALIAAKDFAELETVHEVILSAPEGTQFVVRAGEAIRDPHAPPPEPGKQHKTLPLIGILQELGHEPEVLALDDEWKGDWGDHRSAVRDELIKRECDRVLVFRTPDAKTLDAYRGKDWVFAKLWPNVRTIERGAKAKKKHKKGRVIQ